MNLNKTGLISNCVLSYHNFCVRNKINTILDIHNLGLINMPWDFTLGWVSGQSFAKLWIFYLVERLKSSRRHVLGEYVSLGAPSERYWVNTCHWELPVNGIGWIRVTGRFFLDFSFSQQHVSFNSYLVKHYRLLIYLITMGNTDRRRSVLHPNLEGRGQYSPL